MGYKKFTYLCKSDCNAEAHYAGKVWRAVTAAKRGSLSNHYERRLSRLFLTYGNFANFYPGHERQR